MTDEMVKNLEMTGSSRHPVKVPQIYHFKEFIFQAAQMLLTLLWG